MFSNFNTIRSQIPPISYLKHLYLDKWVNDMPLSQLKQYLEEGTLPLEFVNTIDNVFESITEEGIKNEYIMSLSQLDLINFKVYDFTNVEFGDIIRIESKNYTWGKYFIRKVTTEFYTFN